MRTFKHSLYVLFLLILPYLLIFGSCSLARGISIHLPGYQRVQVHVINRLSDGIPMTLHCYSHDNDLGQSILEDDDEVNWRFRVNFWGTTLFSCDVRWEIDSESDSSIWHHFNAYDADRDYRRCRSECWWMISQERLLYGYNQETEYWELFPFANAWILLTTPAALMHCSKIIVFSCLKQEPIVMSNLAYMFCIYGLGMCNLKGQSKLEGNCYHPSSIFQWD